MIKCSNKYHNTICGSNEVCLSCGKDLHSDCQDCKNWPSQWKQLVKSGDLIPGAFYKNVANDFIAPHKNLRRPRGHMIGAINLITKYPYYFGIKTSDTHWARMSILEVIKFYFAYYLRRIMKHL